VAWTIEFFEDDTGHQPVREFLLDLDADKRAALIAAIELVLTPRGLDVCRTEFGRQLGEGLFEFRVRHDERVIRRKDSDEPTEHSPKSGGSSVLLRVFCHAHGDRVVLLLGGYDKGRDPSSRRQAREIKQARKRLRSFVLRQQRRKAAQRRRA
jgi:hypothetical protein